MTIKINVTKNTKISLVA